MNKFLLSALAIGFIGATCEATPRVNLPRLLQNPAAAKVQTSTLGKKKVRRAATEATGKWCPGTENISVWEGDGWLEVENYKCTYTHTGKRATELTTSPIDPVVTRVTYTYNDNDMLIRQLSEASEEDDEFENTELIEREYDSRLTDVIIANRQFAWDGGDWYEMGNNYNRNITRDAAGNITRSEIAVLFQGEYDPTIRLNMTYGENGKVKDITESLLTYDGAGFTWVDGQVFSYIEWEETNGQIYQIDNLFQGNNRIKRCEINDEDFGGLANIFVEYEENGGYSVYMQAADENQYDGYLESATATFTPLDNYGSYEYVYSIFYFDEDKEHCEETMRQTAKYDSYGNELLSEVVYIVDDEEYVDDRLTGDVTYDESYGYPLTYTISALDYDSGEMIPEMKIEFSDYSLVTSVKGICSEQIEDESAPVEYYNLNGQRVANPTDGIYVRRQGSKVSKVIL